MSARARRRLGPATLAVQIAGVVTALTALPLFAGARGGPVETVHIAAAAAFFAALAVKLAALGTRARPGRGRRLWRLFVAQLGGALAGYTLLTGVLVVLDPAWSDQHLAASFWLAVVVVVHGRHYRARLRSVGASRAGGPELGAALRRLDAAEVALLDLSLRKGLSDAGLAAVLGVDAREVRRRRRDALGRLGGAADVEPRLRQLPPEAWRVPARSRRSRRLVVVGGGMAGQAVVERMAAREGWRITLLGEEHAEPYNRIALSEVLRDPTSFERLALRPFGWYAAAGIDLRLGAGATTIGLDARRVTDSAGAEHAYDALVLATGSRPFIPPIAGAELGHVVAYRTVEDARRIAAASRGARTAVVIGGGLLGLEAAAALAAQGLAITVVEAAERLMPQQLDAGAAALLRRSLARLGVETALATTVAEITASRVRLAGGTTIGAELVVVAAGIRAETALAREAGLDVDRGIVVDDTLRTSAAGVWAVGECAQHRGVVHGLWAPVAQQVAVAVAALDGDAMPLAPPTPQTTLKVAGLEVVALGRTTARADEDEVVRSDGRSGSYAKVVVAGDRLVGAILLGDTTAAGRLRQLAAAGGRVPIDVLDRLPSTPGAEPARRSARRQDELVCRCMAVSRERLERAIDDDGPGGVDAVAAATGAGTGCGSCAAVVAQIVDERRRAGPAAGQPSGSAADAADRSDWASA